MACSNISDYSDDYKYLIVGNYYETALNYDNNFNYTRHKVPYRGEVNLK